MRIITAPHELQDHALALRRDGVKTALVPTMGYLHRGHESLVRKAGQVAERVVVSIFVNPTQFGPGEDLASYPRDMDKDAALLRDLGVDALFAPEPAAMFPEGFGTWVQVPDMENSLCGASRPGHFRGVCTVVLKLLNLAQPDFAVFGEKDWQQLAILRRMVRDLNVPVTLVGCPTVREESGLALSSRNAYLTAEERAMAPQLQAGLLAARRLVQSGEGRVAVLDRAVREHWAKHLPLGEVDYLSFVDPETLQPLDRVTGPVLAAAAVRLGRARLIDNTLLQ